MARRKRQVTQRPLGTPDWRWRSFPVFFAFAMTGFLVLLIVPAFGPWGVRVTFLAFTLLAAVATGHLFTRLVIVPRAARRRTEQRRPPRQRES